MLYFDAHVHLGEVKIEKIPLKLTQFPAYSNVTINPIEEYLNVTKREGIFRSLVFPFPIAEFSRFSQFPFPYQTFPIKKYNDYIVTQSIKHSYLIQPLLFPDEPQNIEPFLNLIQGIKKHYYIDYSRAPYLKELYELLQAAGKVLFLHPRQNHDIDEVETITSSFPKLKIVLAHAGRERAYSSKGIIESAKKRIKSHREPDSLFFETSTIQQPEILPQLVETVGSDHLLWGSDYPISKISKEGEIEGNTYKKELSFVLDSLLSDQVKEKIVEKNFRALFQKGVWVRRASHSDRLALFSLLSHMSPQERKFLSLNDSRSPLPDAIKSLKNLFVAEDLNGSLLGFIRINKRSKGGAFIEEVYVSPSCRGTGVGKRLISTITNLYSYTEMRTHASNSPVISLAEKLNFTSTPPNGNMIRWVKRDSSPLLANRV